MEIEGDWARDLDDGCIWMEMVEELVEVSGMYGD